jgi:hypothetical protein
MDHRYFILKFKRVPQRIDRWNNNSRIWDIGIGAVVAAVVVAVVAAAAAVVAAAGFDMCIRPYKEERLNR